MDESKKHLREEVAALSDTIRELRAELAALRSAGTGHHCHGCHCGGYMWWIPAAPVAAVPAITYPYTITCASTTAEAPAIVSNATSGGGYSVTLS